MRSVSFGKTSIVGEVTPWLHALSARPGSDTAGIAAAGYDPAVVAIDRAGNRSRPAVRRILAP